MTEDNENYNPKKPTLALFIILAAVILAALLVDWIFTFFKERM